MHSDRDRSEPPVDLDAPIPFVPTGKGAPGLKPWRECFYEAMERAMKAEAKVARIEAAIAEPWDRVETEDGPVNVVPLSAIRAALRGPGPTEDGA